jgi:hypothetical protein
MRELKQIEDFLKENSEISEILFSTEFHCIMTHEKLEEYLLEVKEVLKKNNISTSTRKKCYGVIVEALENVMKHGLKEENYNLIFHKFVIGKEGLELCFGNYVSKEDIPNLKKHLELIKIENEDIKELMYAKASDGKPLSHKGGAGVGIFDMALKSKGKINHIFLKIDSKDYFLTMIKVI